MKFRIADITASFFEGDSRLGDEKYVVQYVSNLDYADYSTLSFCSFLDVNRVSKIKAGILLVDQKLEKELTDFESHCIVFCDHPKYSFAAVLAELCDDSFSDKTQKRLENVSQFAHVEDGAKIGSGTVVFPNTTIHSSVSIADHCIVQAGSILGNNGLGDVMHGGKFHRFVHLGKLVIEENVHIGSNVCIPRGMLENTIIGKGTRIANNVNIGHSVIIEENCYISSGVTIGGACKIRKNAWIAPGVTLADHLQVGENTMIGTGAVLIKDAMPNSLYLGNPARRIGNRK